MPKNPDEEEFLYIKQDAELCKTLRKEYKSSVRVDFIRHCASKGLLKGILSEVEIQIAEEYGYLPPKYNVHHITPLSGSGDNSFENLCIIDVEFHDHLHRLYAPLTDCLKTGESILLPRLGLKNNIKVYTEPTPEFKNYINTSFAFVYALLRTNKLLGYCLALSRKGKGYETVPLSEVASFNKKPHYKYKKALPRRSVLSSSLEPLEGIFTEKELGILRKYNEEKTSFYLSEQFQKRRSFTEKTREM